jgi:exodeoxyribonuclease VII small subunit
MPASKARPSFEDLYKQLEAKVSQLEQGGLSLDDSLAAYEEAVGLAQRCQQMLEQAELRITRLKESVVSTEEEYSAGAPEGMEAGIDEEEGLPTE